MEGEPYKGFFFKYEGIFANVISILSNKNLNIHLLEEIHNLIQKLTNFNVSEDNVKVLKLRERLSNCLKDDEDVVITVNEKMFSRVGYNLLMKFLPNILDNLNVFFSNLDKHSLGKISKSESKSLNRKMVDFCMYISFFCES